MDCSIQYFRETIGERHFSLYFLEQVGDPPTCSLFLKGYPEMRAKNLGDFILPP